MRMVAVSTAWNSLRHTSGQEMVSELLELGFGALELDVHVTRKMIQEVQEMAQKGLVRISSLHNYCPVPEGIEREVAAGNILPLSSLDKNERRKAVAQTLVTMDWAARLEARSVILHLGTIDLPLVQREALRLIGAGRREEAKIMLMESLTTRAAMRRPYLDSVIASVSELAGHAEALGIRLGLETRYYYNEIPSLDEFQFILQNVDSRAVGYWHDTGHAHVMEVLGIATQEHFLEKYKDRLIGMHLHNAVAGSDHRPLARGEIDFSKLVPYLGEGVDLILEIHSNAGPEELARSRETAQGLLVELEKGQTQ